MTSWNDLVQYIRNNYPIADETHNMIKLIFETGGMRSQVVLIWHLTVGRGAEEWIQIESPFGEIGQVDLAAALEMVRNTVCGGLSVVGNLVTFRHSIPLLNININEVEWPLGMVTNTADQFERALVGGDRY